MKFTVEKNLLLKKLQLLSKATPQRSTLPIISSALFEIKNNQLTIRSTDLEISVKVICNVENCEEGTIAIPLSKLLEITNVLPQGLIEFNISDIGKVNINCNNGQYTIMGHTSDEFPAEQNVENSQSLILEGKELEDIIISTTYAASKDDLKPVLQGVLFQINSKGIVSVATDGHRLVKLEKNSLQNIDYNGSVVVPTKFLFLLQSLIKKEENTTMLVGDNHIQVTSEETTITTRIIKDPYPDYEGVIPKENNKTLIVNKNIFSDAIKRISIFSNKASRQVALQIENNNLTITTEDPENITTGKETIDCNYDGEPMTIGYNASYLKEVLQHQNCEEIEIKLNTPLNAGLFIPMDKNNNDNKTTLLMPIRLND